MISIPYSRYILYPVSWYSFLIMAGAIAAILLSDREAKKSGLPRDTVIDLSLWIIPLGIAGARIYYVIFSWESFRDHPLSVFRLWEGGLAIYGGIIAGFLVLLFFSKKRKISFLLICDIISPGLVLAQSIGRWGNWFNMEAYGLTVSADSFCFFPLAVQIPADGYSWHLATFFYESLWDFSIFIFLISARRRFLNRKGDIFFFYLFLYAAGRLVIEELRLDSLYASSVRISQLVSVLLILFIHIRYIYAAWRKNLLPLPFRLIVLPVLCIVSGIVLLYTVFHSLFVLISHWQIILYLMIYSAFTTICFLSVYIFGRAEYADNMV